MAAAYWSAILENLPKAALVFDHFHIVKLANEKIDELRRALWREADILKRNAIKGSRYLLLMGAENLPEAKREKFAEALRFNEPLSCAYYLKEELRLLWSQPSLEAMGAFLRNWCAKAFESGVVQMRSLAKTLSAHAPQLLPLPHLQRQTRRHQQQNRLPQTRRLRLPRRRLFHPQSLRTIRHSEFVVRGWFKQLSSNRLYQRIR